MSIAIALSASMFMRFVLSLLFIISIISSTAASARGCDGGEAIDLLKLSIEHKILSTNDALNPDRLKNIYTTLRFVKESSSFYLVAPLQPYTAQLMKRVTQESLKKFLNQIFNDLGNNCHFVDFVSEVKEKGITSFPKLFKTFNSKKSSPELIQAIYFAIALDRITKVIRSNINLQKWLLKHFGGLRSRFKNNFMLTFGPFAIDRLENTKLSAVESILAEFINAHDSKQKELPVCMSQKLLTYNIEMIALYDYITSFTKSDLDISGILDTGFLLAKMVHSPIRSVDIESENLVKTYGAAPEYTSSRQGFKFFHPMSVDWLDIYTVWDMAFVVGMENVPIWLSKLVIPEVGGYREKPERYLHSRVISLLLTMYYVKMKSIDEERKSLNNIDWSFDNSLRSLWAKHVKNSGDDLKNTYSQLMNQNPYPYSQLELGYIDSLRSQYSKKIHTHWKIMDGYCSK